MTREDLDYIGAMNMHDEISNEAYKKIMCHCEEQEPCEEYKRGWHDAIVTALRETHNYYTEDGVFRAIQEESLIGIGMLMQEPKTDLLDKVRTEIETEIGAKQWEDYDYCSGLIKAKRIIDKYREQEPKTGTGWIPVSEKIPIIETDVLLTSWNGKADVGWIDAFGKWHTDDAEIIDGYEPLAWMPLPEPYKESEE